MTSRLAPDATELPAPIAPFTSLRLYQDDSHGDVIAGFDALGRHWPYSPFQRLSWLSCWQAHVGDAHKVMPVTVIGYCGAAPALVLPLALRHGRLGRKLTWRAADYCDYCGPLLDPSVAGGFDAAGLRAVLDMTAQSLGGVGAVTLARQPQRLDDFFHGHIGAGAMAYHVHAHATRLQPDFEAYARSRRSGKSLRKIRARLADLQAKGKLEIGFAQTRAEAIGLVAQCLDLKAAQLKRQKVWNPLASPGAAKMMIAYFGGRIDRDTWVASIRLDGQPLAIGYGFRNDRCWLAYQLAMQQGVHDALSPGLHLLMHVLRHCCAAGVETFDLSLGDEAYKTDWCELRTELFTGIESFGALGKLHHVAAALSAGLRRQISARPQLYRLAKQLDHRLRILTLR